MKHMTVKTLIDELESIRAEHGNDFEVRILSTYGVYDDEDEYQDEYNAEFEIEYVTTMFSEYAYISIGDIGDYS